MGVTKSFFTGFKTTAKLSKMAVLLLAINFCFSLLLAVPVFQSLKTSIGNSEACQRLAEGFDYLWWEEFRDESKGLASTFSPSVLGKGALLDNLDNLVGMKFVKLPPFLLAAGLFYIILHTFLAGGILFLFNQNRPLFSMRRFFEGAGNYFPASFFLHLFHGFFSMLLSISTDFSIH